MVTRIELPLFPLNVVLFPGMSLPLHIFEERYKLMINRCLEGNEEFGVVLIKSGKDVGGPATPHEVGTTAKIAKVERKPEGNMDITVVGGSRFYINEVVETTPYLRARVELVDDYELDSSYASALRAKIEEMVNGCVQKLLAINGEWVRQVQLPATSSALSYLIAMRLPESNTVKQGLLEAPTTIVRLNKELPLLQMQTERLEKAIVNKMWMQSAQLN